jgi:hypothetical protein
VQNLNADQLDGFDSAHFATKADLNLYSLASIPAAFSDGVDNIGSYGATQYTGSLTAGQVQEVTTFAWPSGPYMAWYAAPATLGGRVDVLQIGEELTYDGMITYHILLTNTGANTTTFSLDYRVFCSC